MQELQKPIDATRWMAALCLFTVAMSGCVSRLPGARSSLSPRTVQAERENTSTVRSQSGNLPGDWIVPLPTNNVVGGHSAFSTSAVASETRTDSADISRGPAVRLLTPKFDVRTANTVPGSPSSNRVLGNSAAWPPSTEVRTEVSIPSPGPTGANTVQSAADQIRSIINQKSSNELSQGKLLSDRDAKWQVLSRSEPTVVPDREVTTVESPPTVANEIVTPPIIVRSATFGGQTPPISETGIIRDSVNQQENTEDAVDPRMATDPSVFDRLRGLYDPSVDSGPRQTWKEQFQKLQPSWSPFRERGEPTALLPPESLEQEVPEVTADATETPAETSLLLRQLIAETVDELNHWPGVANGTPENVDQFRRRHQDLRLLQLVADQPGEAIAAIDTMPPAEQDFWQELMLGLAQYRSVSQETDRELALTNAAGQLTSAVRRLSPLAALRCRRLDICSRIFSYGRIETFPSNDFEAGQPILLYAELENFTTEPTPSGTRRTRFDAQLQILHEDDSADPIETINLADITDEASSERSDYYQSFELTVPSHLARGTYRIRIRLRDQISGKATTEVVSFQVR
jgi:hypothetical protein